MSFARAVNKMNKATKKLKVERSYSADPKIAAAEKRLYDAVEKAKKEGIE